MQSGGINNPAIAIIMGIALAFVLDNSPKLKALLSLLGMAEMPQQGTMMRGGVGFGGLIGNIKQSIPTASFGLNLTSATDAARAITSKVKETASTAYQSAQTKTKTIAVSKDTVVKSLNKLKEAFNADPSVDNITKTNIRRCVDQLVAKINQASDTPENVTSEDIADSVEKAEDTTQAPRGEQFVDMVKRVLRTKIDLLTTEYETAINARIQSFKTKYNLGDNDMECIRVLKDAVLADLINKKNSLIDEIMKNGRVIAVIENTKKAAAAASEAAANMKDKVGTFLQQNQTAAAGVSAVKENSAAAASAVKENAASALTKLTSGFGWGRK
jgi:hypothetical protein